MCDGPVSAVRLMREASVDSLGVGVVHEMSADDPSSLSRIQKHKWYTQYGLNNNNNNNNKNMKKEEEEEE